MGGLPMNKQSERRLYGIVFTGLMAAMVFVTTMFLKVQIPTPSGPTMLKVGNIICLLAGLMFGPLYGGLASGIGSALYDLLDPNYAAEAWITFVRFFLMGFLCGLIAHAGGKKGRDDKLNAVAAAVASVFSWLFYIVKNVVVLMMAGSAFGPALIANSAKMITSGVNAVIAVVFSVLLAKPLMMALERAGLLKKIEKQGS